MSTATGMIGSIEEIFHEAKANELIMLALATDIPMATSPVIEKSIRKHKSRFATSMVLNGKKAINIPTRRGNKA